VQDLVEKIGVFFSPASNPSNHRPNIAINAISAISLIVVAIKIIQPNFEK